MYLKEYPGEIVVQIKVVRPQPVDLETYKRRVFFTIKKYRLVEMGDVIYVAVSGGKDSCAALALLKEYVDTFKIDAEIRAFHINLGFKTSPKVEEVVKALAERLGVSPHVVNAKEYLDIEAAAKASGRPICSVCGAVKRYLMNKVPRELGATKVATSHHAHDLLAYYFKNLASRNFQWNFKIVPKVEGHDILLTKIRPLIFARPEENEEFCRALELPVSPLCCEYGLCNATHIEVYEMIRATRRRDPDFDLRLIGGIVAFNLKYGKDKLDQLRRCRVCGEPTSGEICAVCKLRMKLSTRLNTTPP